jgi:hypothetical protein
MAHPDLPRRSGRHVRLRSADVRADPHCSTCAGTGRFVPEWKATQVALPCPRCMRGRSAHALREERHGVDPDVLARSV